MLGHGREDAGPWEAGLGEEMGDGICNMLSTKLE